MNVYIGVALAPAEQASLLALLAGDHVWLAQPGNASAADRSAFRESEVVLGSFPEELLGAAPALRWIQLGSVGIESYLQLDWRPLAGRVVCTNLRGEYAEPMAQTVLAGLLALERGIDQLVRLQERKDWQKPVLHPRLRILRGARVLLLGGGSVTTRLRELLGPFNCSFTVFARSSGDIHLPAELDAALPEADIICAALPDTPGTRHLIDAARIARFKPGVLFANVGRGSLVDEPALVAALHSGQIGGALVDVTQAEPLPPDDPLWTCPRTILTQHTSAGSGDVQRAMIAFFGKNLSRYRRGEPLQNAIDWTRGY